MITPILFAALLTVATPAIAGDWRSIPRTDGVCTLYNENLECVDAARSFLVSSQMRVINVSPNDVLGAGARTLMKDFHPRGI